MGDLGTESAGSALKISSQAMDALLKILKYIFSMKDRQLERSVKRYQLKEKKEGMSLKKAQEKINGKVGYIRLKEMQKAGVNLYPFKLQLKDEQMKKFSEYAKIFGLKFTGLEDKTFEGTKDRYIFISDKDLEIAKMVTEKLTEDLVMDKFNDEIQRLEEIENPTDEQLQELQSLKSERENYLHGNVSKFNEDNSKVIFADVCGEMSSRSLSFDKALNRFTDRDFSRTEPYFVCERQNPISYIEMNSQLDMYAGKSYTRTDYKVYKDGLEQVADLSTRRDGKFTDERFSGRPKNYWETLKNDMKAKGSFSDDIIIFDSREDLMKYQQLYKESLKEVEIQEKKSANEFSRNYSDIKKQLEKQLEQEGARVNEYGVPVDITTNKTLEYDKDMPIEHSQRVAECTVIANQLTNYSEMNDIATKIAMKNMEKETAEDKALADKLDNEISRLKNEMKQLQERELQLKNERQQLQGVEVERTINSKNDNEVEKEQDNSDRPHREDERETHPMEEWQEKIDNQKQSGIESESITEKEISEPDLDMGDR